MSEIDRFKPDDRRGGGHAVTPHAWADAAKRIACGGTGSTPATPTLHRTTGYGSLAKDRPSSATIRRSRPALAEKGSRSRERGGRTRWWRTSATARRRRGARAGVGSQQRRGAHVGAYGGSRQMLDRLRWPPSHVLTLVRREAADGAGRSGSQLADIDQPRCRFSRCRSCISCRARRPLRAECEPIRRFDSSSRRCGTPAPHVRPRRWPRCAVPELALRRTAARALTPSSR